MSVRVRKVSTVCESVLFILAITARGLEEPLVIIGLLVTDTGVLLIYLNIQIHVSSGGTEANIFIN